ncbi:MAG: SDR family NAD(P)-dependent oxidoreductase, partial [Candidatus Cloacimonetes bacterium]|nr:SDR family NAD(P)-dependent oxidoreductase [Candidatus Cloacimonadota bacterium]
LEGSDSPYYETCLKSVEKMASDETNGKSPETAARAIVRMLSRREPPVRCAVGFEYKLFTMLKRLLPARFIEFLLRKMYIPK